jgi:hypothetical protein
MYRTGILGATLIPHNKGVYIGPATIATYGSLFSMIDSRNGNLFWHCFCKRRNKQTKRHLALIFDILSRRYVI